MILEHEAKALLRAVGVAVPQGTLIKRTTRTPRVRAYPVALKAQVRSGGRGKQGGILKVTDAAALAAAGEKLFALEFGGEAPAVVPSSPRARPRVGYVVSFLTETGGHARTLMNLIEHHQDRLDVAIRPCARRDGAGAGRLESRGAVPLRQAEEPEAGAIALLRMRTALENRRDQRFRVAADRRPPPDQA